jgi:hypothetical protein
MSSTRDEVTIIKFVSRRLAYNDVNVLWFRTRNHEQAL